MLFPDEEYLKESWVDIPKLLTAKTKLHDLVDNYKRFLNVNYPNHAKSYYTRLKNQPEGATSEAVVYSFLKANLDDVQVAEKMDVGGVDFKCKVGDAEFVAEVTCLETEAVISQSGLPTGPSYGGHYSMITDVLRTKASGKATQMSRYNCPRVLVMTCQHAGTSAILGIGGAEDLLTSETKIAIGSISNPGGNHLVTDLDNSVFFRWKNDRVESCRRSISAILLFRLSGVSAFITGISHPDPIHKFPIEFLPTVPFVRVKKWPLENNRIKIEWVTHKPPKQDFRRGRPERFWYDVDLRDI